MLSTPRPDLANSSPAISYPRPPFCISTLSICPSFPALQPCPRSTCLLRDFEGRLRRHVYQPAGGRPLSAPDWWETPQNVESRASNVRLVERPPQLQKCKNSTEVGLLTHSSRLAKTLHSTNRVLGCFPPNDGVATR